MRKSKGFTLVELVIVILILGILSATAVPKFLDLQVDARNAALKGLKGSIEGAIGIAYGKTAIESLESTKDANPDFCDFCTADIGFDYGYPNNAYKILPNLVSNLAESLDTDSASDWVIYPSLGGGVFWVGSRGQSLDTGCRIEYTAPNDTTKTYSISIVECQ